MIAPGDFIEAADAVGRFYGGDRVWVCETVVVISAFPRPCPTCGCAGEGLKIRGLPNSCEGAAWCPTHWRTVYRPKEEMFRCEGEDISAPNSLEPA